MNTRILSAAAIALVAFTSAASAAFDPALSQSDAASRATAFAVADTGGYVSTPVVDLTQSQQDVASAALASAAPVVTTHGSVSANAATLDIVNGDSSR
ncbi:hypothetical protein [Oharaeibacter diazotrophicus]|uniref:DUF4148 domain-containing protein n=1 Tax=Oharaeibacter diazotrophicus TaxID=1920512 RepID=A0A4R6RFW6_9HYPH|nr:hypothetical protein [Oharaeibacter diazotrophicus]TDP85170.1 hypothetical protein EDD54_2018 [Oharaeibacter diazotrophicus]BBE74140.1 hypothetical protein OHA_1_03768 [Pleomorphomonas sp. SM30]GLS76172.1 hypothetical protein GCM10007904_15070 [Oharaeibacter diazotrophicus]